MAEESGTNCPSLTGVPTIKSVIFTKKSINPNAIASRIERLIVNAIFVMAVLERFFDLHWFAPFHGTRIGDNNDAAIRTTTVCNHGGRPKEDFIPSHT
jgi:hypothetical protein